MLVVRELGRCPYRDALELQESLVTRKLEHDPDDYLLLLEHDPVYTLGRGADATELCNADARLGIESVRTGRGGGVTFHGPGQLVAYPILSLQERRRDVRRYVRDLEDTLIDVCRTFGLRPHTREGAPGVWVEGRKLASIGVGIRRWITFHGVALNVSTDLKFFSQIVPCRMPSVEMTSLERELGTPPDGEYVRGLFVDAFRRRFDLPATAELQS